MGLHQASPNKLGELSFLGRSRLGTRCPVPPRDKVIFLVVQLKQLPLTSQVLLVGRGRLKMSEGKARG